MAKTLTLRALLLITFKTKSRLRSTVNLIECIKMYTPKNFFANSPPTVDLTPVYSSPTCRRSRDGLLLFTSVNNHTMNTFLFNQKWIGRSLMLLLLMLFGLTRADAQVVNYTSTGATWTSANFSPNGLPDADDNVTINSAMVAPASAVSVGSLTINNGFSLTIAGGNFTVNGATQVNGTLTDNNNAGTNTFNGTFNVGVGGNFTITTSSPLQFGGDITNQGTFNRSGTGSITLLNSLSLNGPNTLALGGGTITVAADRVVTNNAAVTLNSLNGGNSASTWTNGNASSLTVASGTPMSLGILDAGSFPNLVTYSAAGNQTLKGAAYHNLVINGNSGSKSVPSIIVRGNLASNIIAPGNLVFQTGATLTFEESNFATFALNGLANPTFQNVVVNKPGGTLIYNTGAASLTHIFSTLTVASGEFNLGTNSTTIRVDGNLGGIGTIQMGSTAGNVLRLRGSSNAIGTLAGTAGTVDYNTNGPQSIFSSNNYQTLLISGTGLKTLSGDVSVLTTLNVSVNALVSLGASNLRIGPNATLQGAFGTARYFITDGSGSLIKEGDAVTDFRAPNMPGTDGTYPVGTSGGLYNPFIITSLSATVTGVGAISVRAVPTRQPNVPYFNNALTKYWDIVTTNLSAITANANFQYLGAEVIGPPGSQLNYVPRVWNGSALVPPTGASSAGSNPFHTVGTNFLTGQWTALDPQVRTILYSYQSGDWADPNTWTIDPSGSTLVSPVVPSSGDNIVILPGRTVTTAVSRTVSSVILENGATLDFGTTTGNSIGAISGEGTLRISASVSPVILPTGTFTNFVAPNGGTIEYYNLPATSVLPNIATYNNLRITNSSGVTFNAQVNASATINGNLTISRSGSGDANFLFGTGNNTYSVGGNVFIGAGCRLGITGTNQHNFSINGNLTVNGQIVLQNGAAHTASAGRAILTFRGATTNNVASIAAGATATFFDFYVEKNDGFELFVDASPTSTVNFWGAGIGVEPINGILRLGPNLTVPRLGSNVGGNYDLGSSTRLPVLWIDGANVTDGGTGGAIVPYGTLRITAGSLTCTNGQRSVVLRESGTFQIDGGTVNMGLFRTSNQLSIGVHRGSFIMNGGTFNLDGNSSLSSDYAIFSIAYADNGFRMSGGTINISRPGTSGGGLMIGSNALNYNVTGGTINLNVTGNFNFDITSRAPLWNLNVARTTAGTGQARISTINFNDGSANSLAAQPLVVLNNFNLNGPSAFTFNANGNNIEVKGNFNINTGVSLASGANTLIFSGNSAQVFTVDGTLTGGLNNLTVNKGGVSVLTIAGSATTITAAGGLSLLTGILDDGGKTLNFGGNVINNSSHIGTGRITLNGTSPQTIGGNGAGTFQNLEIASTAGAVGSVGVTATNTVRVNGNLNIATDRLFSIGIYRLRLQAASVITATPGAFSNNRYIRTSGFLSDGGIVKTYSNTSPYLFPFGTAFAGYTPATIQFSAAPSAWGTLNIRPVASRQLYVTDPDCYEYYWKIGSTGFSGIPANSVNHTFNYGNLADNVNYIPAYYNFQNIAYTTINDVNQVVEASNNILFTGVSYVNGDFTAGSPAAFGIVVPFYSRANGLWNSPTTWSNVAFGGPPASSIPSASTPVYIGDGVSFFHTVNVNQNNTFSGSLIIDAGSTLNIGSTTGHNFGALPFATAGGAGRLRISSSTPVAEFPGGDFGIFFTEEGGTTEYYTTGTNFSIPTVTAAPTNMNIVSYRNLVVNPLGTNTITLPNSNLEIFENFEQTGVSTSLVNNAASRTMNVRGNMNVIGGTLQFRAGANQSFVLSNDLNVSSGASISVENAGSAAHTMSISGNLTNNGSIDLDEASDVNLSFVGNVDRGITGLTGTAVTRLSGLTIDKGVGQGTVFTINVAGTLTAPSNNWLNLLNGTVRLAKATNLTLTDQAGANFLIPQTSALIIDHPSAVVNVGMVNSNNADLLLAGRLSILQGVVNVGDQINDTHNDLEYASTGNPELLIEGNGVLNVNGQIRRSVLNLLGALTYTQRGNSTVLVRGRNPGLTQNTNHQRAKFEVVGLGSSFTMEDNALLIVDRTGVASGAFGDFRLEPEVVNISGGEIRIGTGSTVTGSQFIFASQPSLWNLTVDGTFTSKNVTITDYPLTVNRDLNVLGGSVFNAAGLNVNIGGNLSNENSVSTPGLTFGGFRPATATQTTTFFGNAATQFITGASGNLTNFANLVINNPAPAAVLNLSANSNIRIEGQLQLVDGDMNMGTSTATVRGNILNNGTISNGSGSFLIANGTSVQDITGNGNGVFGNLEINNSAGAELKAAISVDGELRLTNGLFYINNHLLTIGELGTITGTFSPSRMIRVNGVLSDGGIRKLFPAGPQNVLLPFGVTLKYTPARINVTSNSTAGSVTVKPVNTRHPATTDPLPKELLYYWNTSSTGFSPSTVVTHTYTYLPTDASNGNEAAYVAGRYFNNVWAPQFGIPGTVNAASDNITISGVNYFDGDFTAGEPSEFDQLLVFYSRVTAGDWNTPSSWSVDPVLQHNGAPAVTAPSFNSVVIAPTHTITATTNSLNAPTSEINGTLNLNNTFGHNFGTVTGTGTIRMTPNGSNQYIFPGGNLSTFLSTAGGTIEYNSTGTATLPAQSTYNNLLFTGLGTKNLSVVDVQINGNLTIQSGAVVNVNNRNINLRGNFTNLPGVSGFAAGTGVFTLSGGAQAINNAVQFSNLAVNGAGVKQLNASIAVTSSLTLSSGILTTGANAVSLLSNATVTGGSAASHVNGNLQKGIASATSSKFFEVGDGSSYSPVNVSFTGSTNSAGSLTVRTTAGDHPNISSSLLDPARSVNRFYSITNIGVVGFSAAAATFNFNSSDLDGSVNTNSLSIGRYNGTSWDAPNVGLRTPTSTQVTSLTTFGEFQIAEEFSGGLVWNGSTSSDWNNPANWTPNVVPSVSDDIQILTGTFAPSFLTPGNGFCRNISFVSGASLTVPSGYELTVSGNWAGSNTIVSGSGRVVFNSASAVHTGTTTFRGVLSVTNGASLATGDGITLDNNASLMHGAGTPGGGGTVTGRVNVRRIGSSSLNIYNFWSSPISNGSVNSLGQNRFQYSPSAATGTDVEGLRAGWQSASGAMTVGRGYIATASNTANFNGFANNGSLSVGPLVNGSFTSFNLIGNPYPSALSASAFVAANPQIGGSALYFWDDDGSAGTDYDAATDYAVWNNVGFVSGPNSGLVFNGNIASCQGFFVDAQNTNSVQFNNSMRTTSNSAFFSNEPIERFWLSVTTEGNHYNETLIAFRPDATDGMDNQYDARKMRGNENIAFYSKAEGEDLAIQAIPLLNNDKIVNLGLEASANGPQTLRLKHVDNIEESVQIILEDTKLGVFQNLRNNPNYNYVYDTQYDVSRFRIHLKPAVFISATTESCVQNDATITIHSPSSTSWSYNVTNEQGISVAQEESFNGTAQINNLSGGAYFVMLSNSFGSVLQREVVVPSGSPVTAAISANTNTADALEAPVQFTANVAGATDFTWDFGDGSIVTGTLNPAHTYAEPGVYTVTFIASNANCMEVKTLQITVKANPTGISAADKQSFRIYPNPVSSVAMVQLNMPERESNLTVNVLDAAGRLVLSRVFENVDKKASLELEVSGLEAGVYQVLISGNKFSTTGRITKAE